MNRNGPIIIIEDDIDDQEILIEVFQKLNYPNKLKFFLNGETALAYLNEIDTIPFLILSDINMPILNGYELRAKIRNDEQLHLKCIPYLFFTTAVSQKAVIDAYSASVQGFFIKPNLITELEQTIGIIMQYWMTCACPNNFLPSKTNNTFPKDK
jgi:CheY-like chemotaxis protein